MSKLKEVLKKIIILFVHTTKLLITYLPRLIKTLFNKVMEKLHFSITFKTTAIYTSIISFIYFILCIVIISCFTVYLFFASQTSVLSSSKIITSMLEYNTTHSDDELKKYSEIENISFEILNKDKTIYFTSEKNKKSFTFDNEYETNSSDFNMAVSNNVLYLVYNTKITENDTSYYLKIKRSLVKEQGYFVILVSILFISYIMSLTFVIRTGSKTSKKMLKPIYDMTKTADSISANALHTRLDVVDSHDELKELAETFNNMLDRIQDSYELQNQFVSDASHELRTPISVIQGYINMLGRWGKNDADILEESISAIKGEAENMKELVEKLLFLARADKNTQKVEIHEFQLSELIDEILKETKLIDTKHTILNEYNENIVFNGDRRLLKQAVRIFIDNSIKYTPENGTIKLNSIIINDIINISLEDTGIGIPEKDLAHVFDRFYRCDESRTKETGGTGLGLSIAKWIIEKHNGTIEIDSKLNIGTKITILLNIISKI
ncbi:MAG: ATP-binding protein [Bacillota bacterium]|nr:ATP-binding protein [Bacillota bacterium]